MPDQCVAGGCNNTTSQDISLHVFPKSPKRRNSWDRFVHVKRKDWPGADKLLNAKLCSEHFKDSDYTNLGMFRQKFVKKLLLKPGAVPSIHADNNSMETSSDHRKVQSTAQRKRQVKRVSIR